MSFRPRITPGPFMSKNACSYEQGTKLRVKTREDGELEGYISRNPSKSGIPIYLELIRCRRIGAPPNEEFVDLLRIENEDIVKITVVEDPDPVKLSVRKVVTDVERLSSSSEIISAEQFKKFLEYLETEKIDKVGLNFFGVFHGRDAQVGWVCFWLENELVCIDVVGVSKEDKNFWHKLNEKLFLNKRIQKVMYNARPVVDFLYNKHHFNLENVYDLQVADLYYRSMTAGFNMDAQDMEYKRLSELLKTYIKKEVLSDELDLLEWFEGQDYSKARSLMQRPRPEPRLCKCIALDLKYLIKLRDHLENLISERFRTCLTRQLEGMALGSPASVEYQLRSPLEVPAAVREKLLEPQTKGNKKSTKNGEMVMNGSGGRNSITAQNNERVTRTTVKAPEAPVQHFFFHRNRGRGRGQYGRKNKQ